MNRGTARKILDDPENFDVSKVAEAVLVERERGKQQDKHTHSVTKVLNSWNRKRARIKESEELRLAVKKVWNKHHSGSKV